jgi:archaellum biogenesis ATPase FlaH
MNNLKLGYQWIDDLMPKGIKIPSTTVVTGPAGTAKGIFGSLIAASWLKQGGSLIHILTNFKREHAEKLLSYSNVKSEKAKGKIVYVNFDPKIKNYKQTNDNEFRANLLKPEIFNKVLNKSNEILSDSNTGILTYMTALNMLLFSRTYIKDVLASYHSKINKKSFNLFTFSDNVFADEMNEIREKADNVFYVHGTGIMHLSLQLQKINGNNISINEIETPFTKEQINRHLLEIQNCRQELVPIIRRYK